ncbi:MAG: phospholipid carrier-dependent glycosyltransferase [Candidatus Andersenbacteria bacterium]|nr:phospholipid carrier-dependent glycosyltransferase [Candidatus Andersenbacteria bacterium]
MDKEMWRWCMGALLAMAVCLHVLALDFPREVVFDEVHFGKFVNAYCCTGERFFDIHPPHAKLLIAGAVALTGYDGSFSFDHIGQPYSADAPVIALRIVPALFGILLPFIIYILLRQVGVSEELSMVGAVAVMLDNALLLQTRIIALDGVLLVAQFGALAAYLASRSREGQARLWYLTLAGSLAGLSAGVKFTGLAIVLILAVLWLWEIWQTGVVLLRRLLTEALLFLGAALLIYAAGWWLHYALLPLPGSGDAWQIPTGNLWADTVAMHRKMLSANYHLSATHAYSSMWWTWPVMVRPIFYWQGQGALMYFLGNPVMWWGALCLLLICMTKVIWSWAKGLPAALPRGVWLFAVGYIISLLPFVRIPRALFLYHYATPLLFSLLLGVAYLDRALPAQNPRRFRFLGYMVAALAVGFMVFSPLTYGFEAGSTWRMLLFWFPTWR